MDGSQRRADIIDLTEDAESETDIDHATGSDSDSSSKEPDKTSIEDALANYRKDSSHDKIGGPCGEMRPLYGENCRDAVTADGKSVNWWMYRCSEVQCLTKIDPPLMNAQI